MNAFEHTMPELVRQLARMNDNLERLARVAETTDPDTQGNSDDEHHDDPDAHQEEHQP